MINADTLEGKRAGDFVLKHDNGRHYDCGFYSSSNSEKYGIKIKTNIPWLNAPHMPTVIIEGFCYQNGSPVDLRVYWYIWDNNVIHQGVSSLGSYTPKIKLGNEKGKVVIFIDERQSF